MQTDTAFLEGFASPPNESRPMPFWFWNSKLEEVEIVRQVGRFAEMGLGGFYIHARFGLETIYLSDEWLTMVEAATAEAEALWCLSTGTGIGPFLSMLRTDDPWAKFGRVVLVHSVRHAEELTYRDEIAGIARARSGAFHYVPMVSRETHRDALPGRIPAAIEDGRLEARVGLPLTAENAHAMLCGNPAMVDDVQKVLATRGMRRHRRREPGHITLETYW
jgi:hypothetical protein